MFSCVPVLLFFSHIRLDFGVVCSEFAAISYFHMVKDMYDKGQYYTTNKLQLIKRMSTLRVLAVLRLSKGRSSGRC